VRVASAPPTERRSVGRSRVPSCQSDLTVASSRPPFQSPRSACNGTGRQCPWRRDLQRVAEFAVDIKIAGSLALAISLPTMLVAFARYSRDRSFEVLRANKGFMLAMASGSIIGTILEVLSLVPSPKAC
jgi:hypothetical protein